MKTPSIPFSIQQNKLNEEKPKPHRHPWLIAEVIYGPQYVIENCHDQNERSMAKVIYGISNILKVCLFLFLFLFYF